MGGVAATAGIAMAMQSAMTKQQIGIEIMKMSLQQDKAVVDMLAQSQASVTAFRGNVVNVVA